MCKLTQTFLSLLCFVLMAGCTKPGHQNDGIGAHNEGPTSPNATEGTVDGGGGNSVTNPKNGETILLDLAENIDKEPFDFDIRDKVLEVDKQQSSDLKEAAFQKWSNYQHIHTVDYMKKLIGNDEEFFVWAFATSLRTNKDVTSEFYSKAMYEIHLNAYELKDKQVVTNVRYALTDNTLNDVGDTGLMKISNPETKKQLAVQDSSGFVLINKDEFKKLDANSKIALKMHESILYLMLKFNPKLIKEKGTAPIRKFVQDLFNYAVASENKKDQLVSPDDVRASYKALQFPQIKPNYDIIGKISDVSKDENLICHLEQSFFKDPTTGKQIASSNYHFSKNNQSITSEYAMDIDFFMKIQMYLVTKGICVFKPKPCKIDSIQQVWDQTPAYHYFLDKMPLPDQSHDVIELSSQFLPKYQTARLCE